jgi:3-methyladenine DNA glycosylase AlkC
MEPFKNAFSPQLVNAIADQLRKHIPSFKRKSFVGPILEDLENLELKARSLLIADHLHLALPDGHEERGSILRAMLHPDENAGPSDELGIRGWGMLPLTTVVGQHGLDDFDESLRLLRDMTSRFSSEFAVRYFLLADQDRALGIIRGWLDDPNHHVRRLVSEGTRPRLPWAMRLPRLIEDPAPILPILTYLRDDAEEYVRRSVANHLNDIAKDHPDLVAQLANDWMRGAGKNRQRLVRHACRTLIKQGHRAALEAFGIGKPRVILETLTIATGTVDLGNTLDFSATLASTAKTPQPLVIDYVVHFRKANGKLAAKVFKWKQVTLQPEEPLEINRSHSIRPITTRRYHGGVQALSLRINGEDFGYQEFDLNV